MSPTSISFVAKRDTIRCCTVRYRTCTLRYLAGRAGKGRAWAGQKVNGTVREAHENDNQQMSLNTPLLICGGGLGIVGYVCVMRAARLPRLVVMSSCLAESRSCSGVGTCGRFMSDVASIVCHLLAI